MIVDMQQKLTVNDIRKMGLHVGRGNWTKQKNELLDDGIVNLKKNIKSAVSYGHFFNKLACICGMTPGEVSEQMRKYKYNEYLSLNSEWNKMLTLSIFYNFYETNNVNFVIVIKFSQN